MQGRFCEHCRSLTPPGSTVCRVCGRPVGGGGPDILSDGSAWARRQGLSAPKIVDDSDPETPYLPYEPRGCQKDIIQDIVLALGENRHIVMESGTGTGKTIVSLAGALQHAIPHQKKIVYLTRTISQSDQVMRELKAISKIRPVSGIAITGRGKSCPLFRKRPDFADITPNILSLMCDDAKDRTQKNRPGSCIYYSKVESMLPVIERFCRDSYPTSDEFDRFCEQINVCPYEAKKSLMKDAEVVVAPYIHILSPSIRDSFLAKLEIAEQPDKMVLVVDEAHNIVDAARDQESFSISDKLVLNAIDEAKSIGDPMAWEGVSMSTFISQFRRIVKGIANEKLGLAQKEAIIEGSVVTSGIKTAFSLGSGALDSILKDIVLTGTERTEALVEHGEGRVSELQTFGELLTKWCTVDPGRFVYSVKTNEDGEYLHANCKDPSDISAFLHRVPCAIHMSGTLQPLDQYARVMGLPGNPRFRTYPSPFPPENRSVIYVDDVTTRQKDMKADPSMQTRIEKYIVDICNAVDRNTLVFFTSYANMRAMKPQITGRIHKNMYWEESRNNRQTMENLRKFRQGRNGVFFSVMGGSIAEGIDFPGDELCFAIIVGIPYPPPTMELKAMSDMYDGRFGPGRGWLYTSEVPALRKMKQAIGRLIRTETDRGMAIVLDNRTSKYR
ncbi:MAG: ATP-dependent DNA helicase [Candidatus Methanomethylophilaceae archaeon]|nr:ATP-dependent DNA helicase [Candidatus Methanomethylophilaceae archaeon]